MQAMAPLSPAPSRLYKATVAVTGPYILAESKGTCGVWCTLGDIEDVGGRLPSTLSPRRGNSRAERNDALEQGKRPIPVPSHQGRERLAGQRPRGRQDLFTTGPCVDGQGGVGEVAVDHATTRARDAPDCGALPGPAPCLPFRGSNRSSRLLDFERGRFLGTGA